MRHKEEGGFPNASPGCGEDDPLWEYQDEDKEAIRNQRGLKKKNTAPRISTDTTAPRNVPKAESSKNTIINSKKSKED